METRNIIALVGKKGSGKGVVASRLNQAHDFGIEKFALPIKNMTIAFFEGMDMEWREIMDRVDGDLKESPISVLNDVTSRKIQQVLGTDAFRDIIDPEVWIKLLAMRLDSQAMFPEVIKPNVVIDDCRFVNEAQFIKRRSGTIIKIVRPSLEVGSDTHRSEVEMDCIVADHTIINDGTLEELAEKVDCLVNLPESVKKEELNG